MTIVALERVTLFGPHSRIHDTLNGLQELGCLHLIDLNVVDAAETSGDPLSEARAALLYLKSCSEQRRRMTWEGFERRRVIREVLSVKSRERDLEDERDRLRKAIRDVRPWGEFRMPRELRLGGSRLWFYVVPLHSRAGLEQLSCAWYEASRDLQFAYVVVISLDQPCDVPGTLVELDPRPLSELEHRLSEVEVELEDVFYERVQLTRWRAALAHEMNRADDAAQRLRAVRGLVVQDNVFAIQGWCPVRDRDQLQQFADRHRLAVMVEPPDDDDRPPTLLDNPERLASGEGLVTFYKTPAYTMWDPSRLVLASFALFFAMIMADAGYALVLALLTRRFRHTLRRSQGGRRLHSLLVLLSATAVVYGVLAGSYFGWTPASHTLPGRLRVIDVQSQQLMMPVSIAIGILHLTLANIATIVTQRGRGSVGAAAGWVLVMWGGFAAGLAELGGVGGVFAGQLARGGLVAVATGLGMVLLLASSRSWRTFSWKIHLRRFLDGVGELIRVSSLFGDVLSYLRLFALGLSSAMLAGTFNSLAHDAWSRGGFGVLVAILIAGMGHGLNLILSLMGGIVHGLRLNCIEFFNWSLPDEGYLFRPFAKKARST